jgi:aryl-alcohol dehydrogenase-like predicted oxidoreductase
MLTRAFGPDDEMLSVLGLGCSRIGSITNPTSPMEIRRMLERALELGVTVFDTADVYGQGDSERTLGRFLRSRRERAFVISKVGKCFSAKVRLLKAIKPIVRPFVSRAGRAKSTVLASRDGELRTDFSGRHVTRALDATLRRLSSDWLDAVLLHSPPAGALADGELAAALIDIKKAGKARHVGVSCDDLQSMQAALQLPGLTLLELPLPVLDAAHAVGLTSTIAASRIGVLAREVIRMTPQLPPAAAVASAARRTDVTCVIAGTSSTRHLDELALMIG